MSKKDTSWDLPAGVRNTGLNNLTQAMGHRSLEIVERLNGDQDFVKVASKALTALYDGKEVKEARFTMESVKQLMGGRCFLPDEIGQLLSLQNREIVNIPKLTGAQIEKLLKFLRGTCPITASTPKKEYKQASRTHILFPQPSTIGGDTFGLRWVLQNSARKLGLEVRCVHRIADYHSGVRPSQWFLMYWGPNDESAIPYEAEVGDTGYEMPDLAIYALAMALMKKRVDIRPRGLGDYSTSPRVHDFNELHACTTVNADLNVCKIGEDYLRSKILRPAMIRCVPL